MPDYPNSPCCASKPARTEHFHPPKKRLELVVWIIEESNEQIIDVALTPPSFAPTIESRILGTNAWLFRGKKSGSDILDMR
ncbi:MAG: hypothetical protein AUF79_02230 [Crenarchaeota archaeon 13_1_20CM_2_51_8]|nr:MAG: hypothetical protein AUF79_02230 [Crenarchaeota archaeon 13_1_20CM_2_51_8]